jgi:TnpA family transposase
MNGKLVRPLKEERIETSQLAVDTHGYADFAMALVRLLGFDLCPRLKEFKQRIFPVHD